MQRQTYRITVTRRLQFAKRHSTSQTGKALLLDFSDAGSSLQSKQGSAIGERLALILELPQSDPLPLFAMVEEPHYIRRGAADAAVTGHHRLTPLLVFHRTPMLTFDE